MVCIIDYGIGNLRSMEKALEAVGATVIRSDKPVDIERASHVVLPGVGAFGACADEIRNRDLIPSIQQAIDSGKPFLGVCVGMQLLFEVSEEMGLHDGLGVMPGRVVRFKHVYEPALATAGNSDTGSLPNEAAGASKGLKIPHMGWNTAIPTRPSPLLEGLKSPAYFYFVHSFHAVADNPEDVLASTTYGTHFPAIVQRNNVFGVQFHPEKSHDNGLLVLRNFARLNSNV
ncbi:MAG: imidazole glycerol phosphate synthase subunit HisH [Rhodothermales bacterium]